MFNSKDCNIVTFSTFLFSMNFQNKNGDMLAVQAINSLSLDLNKQLNVSIHTIQFITSSLLVRRVDLPLCKVADPRFHIQEIDIFQ